MNLGSNVNFFRRTDDNCASGPEHGCSQNLEGDMKAIVSSASSNVLALKAADNKKSNKNPSKKKKKHDKKKNNSLDVCMHNLVIF